MEIKELNLQKYTNLKRYKNIFYIGDEKLLQNKILTIVGSRKSTEYGRKVVEQAVSSLKNTTITTCSGFVEGIDMNCFNYSHHFDVPTIVCLGYGFNHFFKTIRNKTINDSIINKKLLVLSQFPFDTTPSHWTYPKRDELLSSVASCVLVVEAGAKSGTEYTVKRAIKEEKAVYVVPGSIFSFTSVGTNQLLKTKSKKVILYTKPKDITELFDKTDSFVPAKNLNLNDIETTIVNYLRGSGAYFDDICKKLKLENTKLISTLSLMEIKGLIKKDISGKYFCA